MPTDPVCGMYVEKSEQSLHATVRGVTYYFCSEGCLKIFTEPERQFRNLKINVVFSSFISFLILIITYSPHLLSNRYSGWILFALATPVQFIAGWRFYRGAYDAIKMRISNMDILIAVGTTAAYLYSSLYVIFPNLLPYGNYYFDTSSLIITLILFGRLLEELTKGKARESIGKLLSLQPATARRLNPDGKEEEVDIERLRAGDILIVKPGEKIPADGVVVEGYSSVDEKMITGESIPVDKSPGSNVIAGSVNLNGWMKIKALRIGNDTALAKIIRIVEEAQSSRGPLERLVDKVSTYFVPIVISIAFFSYAFWTLIEHQPFSFGFTTAIAVLVIACPCALGLATPAAVVTGAGKGAENGILIKGGEWLERMEKVDTIVFDKTGTLTQGVLQVSDVLSFSKYDSKDIIRYAAAAEKRANHPVSEAILKKAKEILGEDIPEPESFEYIAGSGVRITMQGEEIILGNQKMLQLYNLSVPGEVHDKLEQLRKEGKTAMLIAVNRQIAGVIAASDMIRDDAEQTIGALKKMGIMPIMITGDNKETAEAIAKRLGIDRYFAEVMPEQKAELIKQLQREGKVVAMVGDGINDAPALAQADIGIAMASGSDIAVESGQIILMRNNLKDVVIAIQLAKKTMSKVKQNLGWAFGYNIALIPFAAGLLYAATGILLNPILAAAAMALSSVSVTTNSLLLRGFKTSL